MTRFDRWLREKLIYQTHIYCNRLPEDVPRDVRVEKTEDSSERKYRYRLIPKNETVVNKLMEIFRSMDEFVSPQIVEIHPWYRGLLIPKTPWLQGKTIFFHLPVRILIWTVILLLFAPIFALIVVLLIDMQG